MDVTQAVPEDELLLARLATTKLANMLGGVMSTGAAALELPGPEAFFAGRDATLLAFVKVLECVGVKPGCDDAYTSLRAKAENLSHLTITFFKQYVDLCKW